METVGGVCVYGLGAVGGLIAARLARGGVDVSAVVRGATLAAVRERGLRLVEQGEAENGGERFEVAASDDPGELGPQGLVVLAVKATALPTAAAAISPLLREDTVVVTAMNGMPWWFFHGLPGAPGDLRLTSLDPTGAVSAGIPAAQVIGSVLHLSASCPEPGTVRHAHGQRIILGEPSGSSTERLGRVAKTLRHGGFEIELSERIQRDIWFKLWGNLTMNPLSAITGATMDKILDDPLVRDYVSACMREAARVGAAIGLPIDIEPEERHQITRQLGAVKTSMLQDVEAGRAIELDALVTAVCELGDRVAVETPNIDTLLGLARLHARVRGLYPDGA